MAPGSRVAVVGGGITGLAAAFELQRAGIDTLVLEASDRPGGKVDASEVGGLVVDSGPDGFLARDPAAAELCHLLGLGADLVAPDSAGAYLWCDGQLRALPASVLGAPFEADSVAGTGVVSDAGAEALHLGLAWAAPALHADATVGEVLRPRIGDEAFERLVDPLLGGINAGSADRMSIEACAAPLYEAASQGGPFGLALRQVAERTAAAGEGGPATGPVFQTVRGGTARIIDALSSVLAGALHLGTAVESLQRLPAHAGHRWLLRTPLGEIGADGVIITTPAFETARLIEPLAPDAAETLGCTEYSDVVLVTFVIPSEHVAHPLDGSGFLVPRSEGLLMTACSWSSSKWSHYRRPEAAVLRVSAGRTDDRRWMDLEPRGLVARLANELAQTGLIRDPSNIGVHIVGAGTADLDFASPDIVDADGAHGGEPVGDAPMRVRVTPWRRSLPQYRPGHFDRVATVEQQLVADAPGVIATGAAFRGLGLPACIRQGRTAASTLTGSALC